MAGTWSRAGRGALGGSVCVLAACLSLSCGVGVELGAGLTSALFAAGAGGSGSAGGGSAASGPAVPLPPPLKALPPNTLYGHAVLARLREIDSPFKRSWTFKREFEDKAVAGQGMVLRSVGKDTFGALRFEVTLDLDGDQEADMILNYMSPEITKFSLVGEGITVWYEGTLRKYQDQIMVAGTWIEVPF